jgi:tetratricopeptide (TPR) repeat protein
MRSYANVEAATQYERSLEAVGRLSTVSDVERAKVWAELGDARERAGLFTESLDAYRRAYHLVGDDALAQAEMLLKRAWARERAGDYSMALRETTHAKRVVDALDSTDAIRWKARSTALAAYIRQRQERPKDALRQAKTALDEASAVDERAAMARAYTVISWTHLMLDLPGAGDILRKALALYEDLGDAVGQADATNNLGGLAYFEGDWNDALEYYERSRVASERLGNVAYVGIGEMNIGEVLVNQGYLEEAERVLRNASRVLRSIGITSAAVYAEMHLGRALAQSGSIDAAESLLLDVRSEAVELGYGILGFESSLHLAECLIAKDEPGAALELLDDASASVGDEASIYAPTEARVRVLALIALGRLDEAVDRMRLGLAEARNRGLDYEIALLLQLDAELASRDEPNRVEGLLAESRDILRGLGVRTATDADAHQR